MPRITTTYSLLVSCPGDVQDELKIIKDKVEDFNKTFGDLNDIRIDIKHWEKSSYPQSGKRAQGLLNDQFVKDCDLAVAVFWTRFGTPTGDYGSGTEEEIELLLEEGKQVFLYFSNTPINPESVDKEQHQRVLDFRKRYEDSDKGIYYKYNDIKEFEKDFLNHLSMHFLGVLTNKNNDTKKNKPRLILREARKVSSMDNDVKLRQSDYINSKFVSDIEDEIKCLFTDISKIELRQPIKQKIVIDNDGEEGIKLNSVLSDQTIKAVQGFASIASSFSESYEPISELNRSTIQEYANKHDMGIQDDFFYIGNLKKTVSTLMPSMSPFGGSNPPEIHGTDSEKGKYELIIKLYKKIRGINAYYEYFKSLDSLFYIELMLSNCGNRFDEDIDIEIRTNKGCICNYSELPIPDGYIVEEESKYLFSKFIHGLINKIFAEDYSSGNNFSDNGGIINPGNINIFGKADKDYEEEIIDDIEDLFYPYGWFQDEDEDVLQLKMGYLKHGKNMLFPTKLYFKNAPQYIKYEIKSKFQAKPTDENLNIICKA